MFKRKEKKSFCDDETTLWTLIKDEVDTLTGTQKEESFDGEKSRGRNQFRKANKAQESRAEGGTQSRLDDSEREDAVRTRRKKKITGQLKAGKHAKVVYRQFSGESARGMLKVEGESSPPTVNSETEVLLRVEASTVTVNDCIARRGHDFNLLDPICLPVTPGMDVVGQVVEVGDQVTEFGPGDRVATLVKSGGNARYISVPASSLVKVPRNLSSDEAVCMVSVYMTAYKCLRMISTAENGSGLSLKGKKVFVVGGGDPVAQALVHLCNKAKASKIYVSAPSSLHNFVKSSLRATPVLLEESEWPDKVKGEMDFVFDGRCANVSASKACLNNEGKLVIFGMASMLNDREMGVLGAPMSARMTKMNNGLRWSTQSLDLWESFQKDPKAYKTNLADLFQLLKWQKIKPPIAGRVGLSQVAGAQDIIESMEVRGVIVCLPWKRTLPGRNKNKNRS